MGHYLSDFEDRLYRALGYDTADAPEGLAWHKPCRLVFKMGGCSEPVPEPMVKHAEDCNG